MSESMQGRLQSIQEAVQRACERAQRVADEVSILPVSKTFDCGAIQEAMALGFSRFGESRMQEIRQKAEVLGEQAPEWVLIGHLQTNKAKDAAKWVQEVQSLDRLSLAEALETRLQREGREIDVLVQVKTSPEPSKFGLEPSELPTFLRQLQAFSSLRVQGLMTLAIHSSDEQAVRQCFRSLRQLRDEALEAGHDSLRRLSMGMSGDFELAIAEGSTEVRIGSALFGHRRYDEA